MKKNRLPDPWVNTEHGFTVRIIFHALAKRPAGRISVVDAVPIETSDAILPLRPGRLCDTSVSYPLGGGVLFPRDKVDGL